MRPRTALTLAAVTILVLGAAAIVVTRHEHDDPYRFLADLPDGYTLASNGGLSLDTASRATLADTGPTRQALKQHGFAKGEARAWLGGDDTLQVAVFTFRAESGAKAFIAYELKYLQDLAGDARGSVLFDVPRTPGATGFYAAGEPSAGRPLFARGCWFTVGQHAYLVQATSPVPPSVDFAADQCGAEADLVR